MKKTFTKLCCILTFVVFTFQLHAQNVGIGTANPLEKLHVDGNVQINGLASADTNVVLSNLNGKLINLNSGVAGEVLTSQGPGRAPAWAAAAAGQSSISAPQVVSRSISVGSSYVSANLTTALPGGLYPDPVYTLAALCRGVMCCLYRNLCTTASSGFQPCRCCCFGRYRIDNYQNRYKRSIGNWQCNHQVYK